jgi:hypothetical protein
MIDHVLNWMKSHSVPLTVENYLNLAYLGKPPELDAELRASLPKELTDGQPDGQADLRVKVLGKFPLVAGHPALAKKS